jgi:hypothetical protein
LELITGSELHEEKLHKKRLEWQQFVTNHPFPFRDICISNLHECTARGADDDEFHYASRMSSQADAPLLSSLTQPSSLAMPDAALAAASRRIICSE